jgi:hypothetical protein
MIDLLKIHALVRTAGVLVFVGAAADTVSRQSLAKAKKLADAATAWCDARDTVWRQRARKGYHRS